MASDANASPDSGVFVETILPEEEDASVLTEGSSVGSATVDFDNGPTFQDLVDLRSNHWCRIVMRAYGGRLERVCGQPSASCKRPNHKAKLLQGIGRGPEGFYVRYGRKEGFPDGRNDLGPISAEEVRSLEMESKAKDLAALKAFEAPPMNLKDPPMPHPPAAKIVYVRSSPQPVADSLSKAPENLKPFATPLPAQGKKVGTTDKRDNTSRRQISFGGVTEAPSKSSEPIKSSTTPSLVYALTKGDGSVYFTGNAKEVETLLQSGDWVLIGGFPTLAVAANAVSPVGEPQNTGVTKNPSTSQYLKVPPATPPRPRVWYGMVSNGGTKSLVTSESQVASLRAAGLNFEAAFEEEGEARAWKAAPTPPKVINPLPPGATDGTKAPRGAKPLIPFSDPSTVADEVYGVKINRAGDLDQLLLPEGALGKEARDAMFECATDVMALPGAYRRGEGSGDGWDGDHAGTEAIVAMLLNRRETGLHLDYRAQKMNALKQLKKRDEVRDFLERVQEAYEEQEGTQQSQFLLVMEGMGFSCDDTLHYVQEGLLPRLVRDTYTAYVSFITLIAGHTADVSDSNWDKSLPYFMIKHHVDKLGLIRSQSASYRELILRNYTYMRDSKRERFYHPKLNRSLWLINTYKAPSGGTPTSDSKPKCSVCNRSGLHPEDAPCALSSFSAAQKGALFAGLKYRQQQKVYKIIKTALGANPQANITDITTTARQEVA